MGERSDYQAFKNNVVQPLDRLDRVENLLSPGMPDFNFCGEDAECWIELKSPTEPKRPTTPLFGSNHRLSQDQLNWFLRHRRAGGRGFVLISTDKRWILVDAFFADSINKATVFELLSVAVWSVSKPVKEKHEWNRLRSALLKSL